MFFLSMCSTLLSPYSLLPNAERFFSFFLLSEELFCNEEQFCSSWNTVGLKNKNKNDAWAKNK